ncbi:MYND finger [Popillia japonica]|uniref:MYND finger n=1 Tax=Popillia japonica TaxID=7064 RepID=A0AAW1IU60_POPJA
MPENLCGKCGKPAETKCSACKIVYYCCKEHQVEDWKTHKNECKACEMIQAEGIGKCLIAKRDIQPGDIIMCETSTVFGPRPHIVEEGPVPCPGCCRLIKAETSPRCEGCDWPVCHPDCIGLKDPSKHGHECFILRLRTHRALDGLHEYYRQDALFALRCLLLQRRGIKKWTQFLQLESHMEKRGKGTEVFKEYDERVVDYLEEHFLKPLKALEQESKQSILPDMSRETLHQICGIIDVNALEINQGGEVSALYPTACLMEHNCIPNTVHTFEDELTNYRITVRATLPIKKGERVTTMYTHSLWGTQARREHLKETKYFSCTCDRCKDPTEMGTYLSALRCLGTESTPCGGTQLPVHPLDDQTEWACDKCNVRVSNVQASYLINQIGDDVDNIQLNSPTVRELDNLLSKLLTFLHPNHYHCFSVKHSLVQLFGYQQGYLPNQISDDQLKRKTKMCREMLDILRRIDPGKARLCLYTGVVLHELHLANIIYVKRKWDIGTKKDLFQLLKEADKSITECKEVLKYERPLLEIV